MDIIITGVAGFIGSNLAKLLLDNGHRIIGIDNFSYGFKRNLATLYNYNQFQFIEGDVRDKEIFNNISGQVIVHLASQKIPRYSNHLQTLDDNYIMLKNVIHKSLADKSRLVFASTSDVYGKNPNIPFHEESDLVMGPTTVKRWAYALSKMYGEQLLFAYHAENDLEFSIMRFFGSYGPNQNTSWWGGPQAVFISRALEGIPLEVHGTGTQTRTFTYIDDTIQGVNLCITSQKAANQIFNIASEPTEEINIFDLATMIWEMVQGKNKPPQINLLPYSTFGNYEDVMRRVPNIDKIKNELGYSPKFSVAEGMIKTVEWQRNLSPL